MKSGPRAFIVFVAAANLAAWSEALAQTPPPPRQPQGLFGAIKQDNAKTTLDVTASVIEGYDNNVPVGLRSTVASGDVRLSGFSTLLDSAAAFSWRNPRTQVGANATSVMRYYADTGDTRSVGHSAGLGVSSKLPGRVTLMANQAAAYTPTYLFGLFPAGDALQPGDAGTTAPDYSISDFETYTYTTSMSVRHDLSRRTNFTLSGDYQYTDRQRETVHWRDVTAHWLRGQFWRQVARNTTLTAQYQYRGGEFGYGGDGRTTEHRVDFGVNHTHVMSASRRATFHFAFGASGADLPQVNQNTLIIRREYLGTVDAGADYQFGRTWQAKGNFRRGLEYIADLPEPVFANGMSGSVDGFLSRRVDVAMSAGYSSGESALNPNSLLYDTYTGAVRVRYALTRQLAAYTEYLYYYYSFHEASQLLAGVPPGLERKGVRAGVTLWMPALRR